MTTQSLTLFEHGPREKIIDSNSGNLTTNSFFNVSMTCTAEAIASQVFDVFGDFWLPTWETNKQKEAHCK